MRLLALAIRNLSRNKRRTTITGLAIVVGSAATIFLSGFLNGVKTSVIEPAVMARAAAIQVHRAGYYTAENPLKLGMKDDPAFVARMEQVEGVIATAPRIAFEGMASNGLESTMFLATGIDPELEHLVCPKRRTRIKEGSRPIVPGSYGDALVGGALADTLGANIGSTIVLQSTGPQGRANAIDVQVAGFLPVRWAAESKRLTTVPLQFARDLLHMQGQVTEYGVAVADLDDVESVAARLRTALGPDYEVTTWTQIETPTRDYLNMLRVVMTTVLLTLFFLVATGIVNTMFMSVHERVREIGTMIALGLRRRQVALLFSGEAISLGVAGTLLGTAIGYGLVQMVARRGFVLHPPGGDPTSIIPQIGLGGVALAAGAIIAGTALAGLYPAWKASRKHPAEALREV